MKSFIAGRIRNVVAFRFGTPLIIAAALILAVYLIVAATVAAVLAPVEEAKNAVANFFSLDEQDDSEIDLSTCLGITPDALRAIVQSVPPRTDVTLAWAWIAYRSEEVALGIEPPVYDGIVTFQESPAAPAAPSDSDPDVPPKIASIYDLAATAGVIDLIQREMIPAPDDLADELTVLLVDNCMS